MIREEIKRVLAKKEISIYALCKEEKITNTSLYSFLNGADKLGINKIEILLSRLSIHIVDEDGNFFAFGDNFSKAIKRGIVKNKISAYQLSQKVNMSYQCLCGFIAEKHNTTLKKVEQLLTILGLQVQEITPPSRLPRIKGIPRIKLPEPTFSFGIVIRERLAELGISLYRFAVDNGFNTGGISVFLNKGTALGIDEAERIFQLLNLHLKDDTTDYGTDLRGAIIAKTGKCPVRASVARLNALAIGAGLKLCKP